MNSCGFRTVCMVHSYMYVHVHNEQERLCINLVLTLYVHCI